MLDQVERGANSWIVQEEGKHHHHQVVAMIVILTVLVVVKLVVAKLNPKPGVVMLEEVNLVGVKLQVGAKQAVATRVGERQAEERQLGSLSYCLRHHYYYYQQEGGSPSFQEIQFSLLGQAVPLPLPSSPLILMMHYLLLEDPAFPPSLPLFS